MAWPWGKGRLRGFLARAFRNADSGRRRQPFVPNLQVLPLEERRVLSGLALASLSTEPESTSLPASVTSETTPSLAPAPASPTTTTVDIDAEMAAAIVEQLNYSDVVIQADAINVLAEIDASGATGNHRLILIASTITFSDGANVTTQDGDLVLQGCVTLADGATVVLSTGTLAAGDISILGSVDGDADAGDERLSLLAGTGTIIVDGQVGEQVGLGTLTVVESEAATFTASVTADTITLADTEGDITFQDDLTAVTLNTTAEDYRVILLGDTNAIENGATFANTGGVTLGGDGDTSLTALSGSFAFEGPVVIDSNAAVSTWGGDIRFLDTVDVNGDVSIYASGSIVFESTLVSPAADAHSLTLAADADIEFHDAVGAGPGNALGALTITTAVNVTAYGTIDAASLTQLAGFGTTKFYEDVTTTAPEGVNLAANQIVLDGLTVTASEGGGVRFGGPVDLAGDVEIVATDSIVFESTVISSAGRASSLTLSSESNVEFRDTVGEGAANQLGELTIVTAVDVTADATIQAASLVQLAGTGTTLLNGDVTTTGASGVDLTTGLVILGGLTITTSSDEADGGNVRFNAPVDVNGDSAIDASGSIVFESTLVSPAADAHSLTLAADADIEFHDAVGAGPGNALGALTITTAVNVTAYGTIDAASLAQLAGFGTTTFYEDVTTTAPEGVNLAANQIVLDGLTVTASEGGGVRFGGPVDLAGDVEIVATDSIVFESTVISSAGRASSLTLSSESNVEFRDTVGEGAANQLGELTIVTAVDVTADATIQAASLLQLAGTGTTLLNGDVTTTGAGGVDLTTGLVILGGLTITTSSDEADGGNVRFNAPVDVNGDSAIDASGSIVFESTLVSPAADAHSLTLAADADIEFRDAVGAGPGNALGALTITTAVNVTADGTIDAASLTQLAGFGTTTFYEDVTTTAPEGVNLTANQIVLDGQDADGLVIQSGEAGLVRFNGPVELQSDVAISTDGGVILFTAAATVDSELGENNDLALTAGAGSVSVQANIGDTQPIGQLTVTRADAGVAFGGSGGADSGPVTSVRALGGIDLGSEAAIADGITLDAGDGNTISFTTGGNAVRFNGPVVLDSDVRIDTTDAGSFGGAEIRFTVNATIDSQAGENNDLTLTAGEDGAVSFNANLGEAGALGQLIVTDAGGVAFGNDVSDADPDLAPVTLVRVEGDFDPANADAYDINLGSVAPIGDGGITFNGGDGNAISLVTTSDAVRLNGAVQLASDVLIDTSDGGFDVGAEIRFTVNSPVDSQADENNDLTLTAGADGTVNFNADIGANAALGQLIVTDAAGVAFGNDASDGDPDLAPLALVRVDGDSDPSNPDAFDIDLGSVTAIGPDGIALNGGDGNMIAFVTTSDAVRFNGVVQLQSDVLVDTSDAGVETGAEIRFTVNATIDSQAGENNDLTLTAGADGTVSFNADIGTSAALGQLIVTDAAGVAFGNAPSYADADLGPVTAVWIDGDLDPSNPDAFDLDVGAAAAIGDAGITFYAGEGQTSSIFTTGDAVRLCGAVELQSDALIDTTGAGVDAIGADILISGTVDGAGGGDDESLSLISHSGTILVTGAVGANVPLDTLSLQDDQPESTGAAVFQGPVYVATLATVGQPYAVQLLGGGEIVNPTEFLNTGGVTLGDSPDDDLTFDQGLISTASQTSVGGVVRTLDGDIQLADVLVIADARLMTAGGMILFGGDVDGELGESNDLELTAATGAIEFQADVGSQALLDRLVVVSAGTVTFGSDDAPVTVVKADGGVDLGSESTIDGGIYLNGGDGGLLTISTAGGEVRLNGAVELQSDACVNASDDGEPLGAEIRFTANSPIDSQAGEVNNLTLTAGTDGTVSFNADVGASAALGRLIVTDAAGVAFGNDPSDTDADLAPIATVRVDGDPSEPDAFAIDVGSATAIGEGGIVLNAGDGNTVSLITTADRVRLNGPTILESNALIDTTDAGAEAGAEIRFTRNATIDGRADESNGLTLTAGTAGTVGFYGDIGATAAPSQLIVTDAAGVAFGGIEWEDMAPISTVRVDGDPSDPTAYAINVGSVTAIGPEGITLNGGNTLSGDPLTLTMATTSDAVRFNGTVELQSDAAIDTTDGDSAQPGAEIRFTHNSPVDSQAGETNDLTLTAGADGTVSFNADLGASGALGQLIVNSAAGVRFGNDANASDPDLSPIALVNVAGDGDAATYDLDVGAAGQGIDDPAIGADGIVLNGGDGTIVLNTSGGDMRLNGAVTLASDALLDTTANGASGAAVLFTVNGLIDSQAGESNDLTLTSGSDGQLSFNANIGDTQPIGTFTITQADAGVFFGGDDDATDGDDLGPVTTVNTDGAIDLGAGTNAITGGILFNGGSGILTMTTTADDVRLNGPVTLGSALAIDTQSGDNRIEFTRQATIDSQAGEENDLTLNAGPSASSDVGAGGVFFYGNVGTGSAGDQSLGDVAVDTSGQIVVDPAEANGVVQTVGDLTLNARGDIEIVSHEVAVDSCQVVAATVTVNSGEVFTIDDGAVLKSDTGAVTNAGPRLTLDPQDPNDAITPGDPTQTISGTIGIDGSGNYTSDNLEQGQNFTLIIVWSDTDANGNQIVTVIRGLSAGQNVTGIVVDQNGNISYSGSDATVAADGSLVFQPSSGSGPITFQVTRVYSLGYLMTLSGDVSAIVILGNDNYTTQGSQVKSIADAKSAPVTPGNIVLDDSRKALDGSDLDLNRSMDVRYKHLAGEQFRFAESPTAVAELAIPEIPQVRRAILSQAAVPEAANRVEYAEVRGEDAVEEARILVIVKVGPNGEEGEPHQLPIDALADLAGLFEKFKQEGLPNGLYRIYLKEAGFPRRKLIEFYKSGTSIGDPVREPGPGANPMREEGSAPAPADRPRGDAPRTPAARTPAAQAPAAKADLSTDSDDSADRRLPLRSAHPVVGAAVLALTGLSTSGARGRWARLVEKAMKESGDKSFHRAARLQRRLRRPR